MVPDTVALAPLQIETAVPVTAAVKRGLTVTVLVLEALHPV